MFKPSDHLRILAGPFAIEQMRRQGLQAEQIIAIAGAAGGPKGLILGPLDQFIFGHWLKASEQPIDLIGASIGCWRLAAACAPDPEDKLKAFSKAYIEQDYRIPEGQRRPSPTAVSASFADGLSQFFGGLAKQVLEHGRYRLHVVASRGSQALARAAVGSSFDLSLAFARAWLANAQSRHALGAYLERIVFSSSGACLRHQLGQASVKTDAALFLHDFPARQVCLDEANWLAALQASCSIPMVLDPVWDLQGAPQGPYWDGGLTDYHLRLNYTALKPGLVLYPHFVDKLIPGWLDKPWFWRHRTSAALDNLVLLCPGRAWLAGLPDGRLPDRHDFVRFAHDPVARMRRWRVVLEQAQSLARAFECFTRDPACIAVEPL